MKENKTLNSSKETLNEVPKVEDFFEFEPAYESTWELVQSNGYTDASEWISLKPENWIDESEALLEQKNKLS